MIIWHKLMYEVAYDNEWVQPRQRRFKLECCDCGLIHEVDFRIVRKGDVEKVQFRARRERRETARNRKKNFK